MTGTHDITADAASTQFPAHDRAAVAVPRRSRLWSWLRHDLPYITMLVLALIGIVFRLEVQYWLILTPVFGMICIVAGWRHFHTRFDHLQLVYTQVLNWLAFMLTIYLLHTRSAQGVMTVAATDMALLTLLALGTFVAGLQAHLWRMCAVGGVLFLAVPGVSWLDQSMLEIVTAAVLVILAGGFTWWVSQARSG